MGIFNVLKYHENNNESPAKNSGTSSFYNQQVTLRLFSIIVCVINYLFNKQLALTISKRIVY